MLTVRRAARADIRELATVLGRAFHDDPVCCWLFPDEAIRRARLPRMFAALARHVHRVAEGTDLAVREGGVVSRVVGVAIWDRPGHWPPSRRQALRSIPALLAAMGPAVRRSAVLDRLVYHRHPLEPHWYLAQLGSDPRGAGAGTALLRERLAAADREGRPAYLESSSESNVGYYQRFGFVVTGEVRVPDGPALWLMWRPAQGHDRAAH